MYYSPWAYKRESTHGRKGGGHTDTKVPQVFTRVETGIAPPPTCTQAQSIHHTMDVGNYAPVARTTLNLAVFIVFLGEIDLRLANPRVHSLWARAGAFRHPAMVCSTTTDTKQTDNYLPPAHSVYSAGQRKSGPVGHRSNGSRDRLTQILQEISQLKKSKSGLKNGEE